MTLIENVCIKGLISVLSHPVTIWWLFIVSIVIVIVIVTLSR